MDKNLVESITSKVMALRDENQCWNVLKEGDRHYPDFNYYMPKYKSTLWTLVLLADIGCEPRNDDIREPLEIISNHFVDRSHRIYTVGKSHFPIPCLNGNMIYLHSYFGFDSLKMVESVVDFFGKYQRFDDGDFKTPSAFPYCSNRSCYGNHTCYWGIVKLFKGLSFIPIDRRSEAAKALMKKCIDFILLHDVCFSSHDKSKFLHKSIQHLTFPNMYRSDFLEILWLLKRERVDSSHVGRALELMKSKMQLDSTWKIERPVKNLIVPIGRRTYGNEFVTERAREVIGFYRP